MEFRVEGSVGGNEVVEVNADVVSIRADLGEGTFVEGVGFTNTGFPDLCIFWNGNRSPLFLSLSVLRSMSALLFCSTGGGKTPREVLELYPLSVLEAWTPSLGFPASRFGGLAASFLGDRDLDLVGWNSTADENGASSSSSGSATEKNEAGDMGRSVTGDESRVSSMNERWTFVLSG